MELARLICGGSDIDTKCEVSCQSAVATIPVGEHQGVLSVTRGALLVDGEQSFPFEMTEHAEVFVGTSLRLLTNAKERKLGDIYWDQLEGHSLFSF